jgi:hypothetical protein
MSWHTTALLIRKDYSKDFSALLATLGLEGAELDGLTTFDEATSSANDGIAIGYADGWTVLWGNVTLLFVDQDAIEKIAKKTDVFTMILEGASDTAGFTWYTGGKQVRDWMRQAGEIIENVGRALPIEKKAFAKNDDEQAVLQIMLQLTLSLEALEGIRYEQYNLSDALFG